VDEVALFGRALSADEVAARPPNSLPSSDAAPDHAPARIRRDDVGRVSEIRAYCCARPPRPE
jgi:hypothetical protein